MTRAWLLVVALEAAAAASAWWLQRRAPGHRPVFWTLLLVFICDVAGRVLIDRVLTVSGPYTGGLRVAFHLTEALFCAYPAAVAALALFLATERRGPALGVLVVSALFVAALVAGYPALRAARLEGLYTRAQIAVVVTGLVALAAGWSRRIALGTPHAVVLVLVLAELAQLAGPFLSSPFRDWHFAQITYACAFGAAALIQLEASWTTPCSTSSLL